jgi:DNA-binding NtrC family response regulator
MSQSGNNSAPPLAYLVDDEPMLLDLNEAALRSLGFDVRRFRAAEQALEAYRAAAIPPALIITDYAMHRLTGLDLIDACRRLHPGQKFLLLSGTVDDTVFRDCEQKPDGFMAKPYSMSEFAEAVRTLVGA